MAVYKCSNDCDGTFATTMDPTHCPFCGDSTAVQLEDYTTKTDKV